MWFLSMAYAFTVQFLDYLDLISVLGLLLVVICAVSLVVGLGIESKKR